MLTRPSFIYHLAGIHLFICIFAGILFTTGNTYGQTVAPTPPADEETIRVNTKLVQLEAIVRDKKGNLVTDLTAEDFELIEDNRKYPIEYFSFVPTFDNSQTVESGDKRLQLHQVRRTFVFIVSVPVIDLLVQINTRHGANATSTSFQRLAMQDAIHASNVLKNFVEQQMGANDLVSIIDEDSNLGLLSGFTNERQILLGAADQIGKKFSQGRFSTVRISATLRDGYSATEVARLVEQNLNVIRLGENSIEQLSQLPGRKIVVLFSRGLLGNTHISEASVVTERIKELVEKANKANVTFYSLHLKSLDPESVPSFAQGLDSMKYLAEQTGGKAIFNNNDLRIGMGKIVEENNGYYQLAFVPDEADSDRPYRVSVKIKRPDLEVQYRSNVYQQNTDSEKIDGNERMLRLLRSPFATPGVKVTLSTEFKSNSSKIGNIKTVVNIDPNVLEPKLLDNGIREIDLTLGVQITRPDNKLQRQDVKKFKLKLSQESWQDTLKHGLVYQFDTKTESAGFYRINVLACVNDTSLCGTSSDVVNTSTGK